MLGKGGTTRESTRGDGRQDHGAGDTRWWWVRHAPVLNPGGPLLRPVRQRIATSATGAPVPAQAKAPAARHGLVRIEPLRAPIKTMPNISAGQRRHHARSRSADLAEQHFGDWRGLTYVEIAEKHGSNHLFWLGPPEFRPPGGEASHALRVAQCAASTADRSSTGAATS